jgi:poly(3-hydroxybutyrate) depolymerase
MTRKHPIRLTLTLTALLFAQRAAAGECPAIAEGSSQVSFAGWAGPELPVYLHRPSESGADSPIVFVMHGVNRDGDRYRDEWRGLSEQHGFIVAAPNFGRDHFPTTASYNMGNIFDGEGKARPREQWSFAAIEPLFDELVCRLGSRQRDYALYGHSAGGQFVHRYIAFADAPRLRVAVAANSGWYTMPDARDFPYGWGGSTQGMVDPATALSRPLTVLLGTQDTDRNDPDLRRNEAADRQGPNRLERGEMFFATGRDSASAAQTDFAWRIAYAPGIAHSNAGMAAYAVPFLLNAPAQRTEAEESAASGPEN